MVFGQHVQTSCLAYSSCLLIRNREILCLNLKFSYAKNTAQLDNNGWLNVFSTMEILLRLLFTFASNLLSVYNRHFYSDPNWIVPEFVICNSNGILSYKLNILLYWEGRGTNNQDLESIKLIMKMFIGVINHFGLSFSHRPLETRQPRLPTKEKVGLRCFAIWSHFLQSIVCDTELKL